MAKIEAPCWPERKEKCKCGAVVCWKNPTDKVRCKKCGTEYEVAWKDITVYWIEEIITAPEPYRTEAR